MSIESFEQLFGYIFDIFEGVRTPFIFTDAFT